MYWYIREEQRSKAKDTRLPPPLYLQSEILFNNKVSVQRPSSGASEEDSVLLLQTVMKCIYWS